MRPQVRSTLIFSILGFSLALNAALLIGHLRGQRTPPQPPVAVQAEDNRCLLDSLKLDAEQQDQLVQLRRKMLKKRTAYWQHASTLKVGLAKAICAAEVDRTALDAQLKRYADNQGAMQRAVAHHLLRVSAMLRPQQRVGFRTVLRTEMFRGIRASRRRPAGTP